MLLRIQHHIVLDNSPALCELIDAITGASKEDKRVKELEKQMDDWLMKLNKAFKKLEKVSDKVDSTK